MARSRRISLALLTGFAVAAAIVALDFADRMDAMQPRGEAANAVTSARPGKPVKAMLKLAQGPAGGGFAGAILEDAGSDRFRLTQQSLRVVLDAGSRFVMGSPADLAPGAVVQVAGTAMGPGVMRAAQVVVLTGYVSVLPKSQ